MNLAIYLVAALLVVTKLFDVVSTLKNIRHAGHEANPWARRLMQKLGIRTSVWLFFALAVAIIVLATGLALEYGVIMQLAFILLGTAIAFVQGAVAWQNLTGRENFITSRVRRMFYRV